MKKKLIIITSIVIVLSLIVAAYFLFIKKDKETITITFDTDGGNTLSSIKTEPGEIVNLPTPQKEGFTFISWRQEDKDVPIKSAFSTDTLLKAYWNIKTYTITFDSKSGSKVNDINVECGKELKLPANPTKKDYNFVAWEDKNGKAILDGALLSCEDITLYANWEKQNTTKTFTVSFDSKGGNKVNNITVTCGKNLPKLPTPTRNGYDFVSWYDKNGKTIGEGAKLTCENITLYADWKAKKTYTCPSGYTLSGTNCVIETTVKEKCPDGTKVDGSLCIKTSDNNEGTRVCKQDTVAIDGKGHTWTGKGDYYLAGFGHCAYYKWSNYTTQTQCTNAYDVNHKTTWVSALNACYAEVKNNNYDVVCSGDYQYYSSNELSSKFGIHDNGKCLRKVAKTKYCDSDYTLTNGKCVKTVKATEK